MNDAPRTRKLTSGSRCTGADVTMQGAGITLVKADLRGIARPRRLSQATMRNIRESLVFAFVYNAGVPIAADAPYPVSGLLLSPVVASAAMTFQLGVGDRESAATAQGRAVSSKTGASNDRGPRLWEVSDQRRGRRPRHLYIVDTAGTVMHILRPTDSAASIIAP